MSRDATWRDVTTLVECGTASHPVAQEVVLEVVLLVEPDALLGVVVRQEEAEVVGCKETQDVTSTKREEEVSVLKQVDNDPD